MPEDYLTEQDVSGANTELLKVWMVTKQRPENRNMIRRELESRGIADPATDAPTLPRPFDPRTEISAGAYHVAGTSARAFDPRTEISADAKHIASRIVTHLWILFVLLPVLALFLTWFIRTFL
jgi:hypothetical protein